MIVLHILGVLALIAIACFVMLGIGMFYCAIVTRSVEENDEPLGLRL